jgi:hypothetical protein
MGLIRITHSAGFSLLFSIGAEFAFFPEQLATS